MKLGYPLVMACAVFVLAAATDIAVYMAHESRRPSSADILLADLAPAKFLGWRRLEEPAVTVNPSLLNDDGQVANPYDKVLVRNYQVDNGPAVTLLLAWRRELSQENKIHRPELCYFAQGFVLSNVEQSSAVGSRLPLTWFAARAVGRSEAVVYWVRVGDEVSVSALNTRRKIFLSGLTNRTIDGLLVRASVSMAPNSTPLELAEGERLATRFLTELVGSMSPTQRAALQGETA